MKFSEQDKEEYKAYLREQIRQFEEEPDSIAKFFNIQECFNDIKSL
jgi:hypothetical protein